MGCMYSKSSAVEDSRESPKDRFATSKRLPELKDPIPRLDSSRRETSFRGKAKSGDVSVILIDKKVNGSRRLYDHDGDGDGEIEKKITLIEMQRRERAESAVAGLNPASVPCRLPKAAEGEQVAAGWPVWLSAVAGEAIDGWLPRRADTFEKLDKIGQGTYSSVYRARDITCNKIVALKRVRFDNLDRESVKFMCREITILRRLDHQNIIKLEGLITSRMSNSLYLVFEYMEHDLTGLAARPGVKFTEPQIKCYMQQLLSGLDHCHRRGILHRDIKGSNLLIDNNGILKIADFGLASFFDPDRSVPLTSRVVTLWYRPPELLLGATHYGVEVDLWSSGCILGELYSGKPILPGKTEVEQLHKIFKLCGSPSDDYWRKLHLPHAAVFRPPQHYRRCVIDTFKELPPVAIGLLETLLSVDPSQRGTATLALRNEFFTTSPIACDPSELPNYPPSKEIDAKLQEEEARRKGTTGGRNQDSEKKLPRDFRPSAASNADAEYKPTRQSYSISRNRSELPGSQQDQTVSGFLVGPHKDSRGARESRNAPAERYQNRVSYSGPLAPPYGLGKVTKELDHSSTMSTRSNLSTLSGLVASRTGDGIQEKSDPFMVGSNKIGRFSGPIKSMEPLVRRQDSRYHSRRNADDRPMEEGRVGPRESSTRSREPGGNKIFLSGPLLASSNNVDQLLKEHDRRIQEYARRVRVDKSRNKDQAANKYVSRQVTG